MITTDYHTKANVLTNFNNVQAVSGLNMQSAEFIRSRLQSLSTTQDLYSIGSNVSADLICNVKLNSLAQDMIIICKGSGTSDEWNIGFDFSGQQFVFRVNNLAGLGEAFSTVTGGLTTGQFYFLRFTFNNIGITGGTSLRIEVNNNQIGSKTSQLQPIDGSNGFSFGWNNLNTSTYFEGLIDSCGFWRTTSNPSGGAIDSAIATQIWNNGDPLSYEELTASIKASLQFWYEFDENQRVKFHSDRPLVETHDIISMKNDTPKMDTNIQDDESMKIDSLLIK